MIDVTQPFKREFFAVDDKGIITWYRVTYERLPMFCFLCGVLGHGEAQCPTRFNDEFQEPDYCFLFENNSHDIGAPLPLQAMGIMHCLS